MSNTVRKDNNGAWYPYQLTGKKQGRINFPAGIGTSGSVNSQSPDGTIEASWSVVDGGWMEFNSSGGGALFGVSLFCYGSSGIAFYDQDTFTTNNPPVASTDKYFATYQLSSQFDSNIMVIGFRGEANAPCIWKSYIHGGAVEIAGENIAGTEVTGLSFNPEDQTVDFGVNDVISAPKTATTTQLADNSHAINTSAAKVAGYQVFNTTTGAPVWSVGSADASVWNDATGSTAHTPV